MQTLEDGKHKEADIAGIEFKRLVAGFLRQRLSQRLAPGRLRLKQLESALRASDAQPGLPLKKVATWQKRDRVLLALAQNDAH